MPHQRLPRPLVAIILVVAGATLLFVAFVGGTFHERSQHRDPSVDAGFITIRNSSDVLACAAATGCTALFFQACVPRDAAGVVACIIPGATGRARGTAIRGLPCYNTHSDGTFDTTIGSQITYGANAVTIRCDFSKPYQS
jgi:hypothetical protein